MHPERKALLINFRVSRDEKRELSEIARARGVTLSQLFRDGAKALGERVAA
jgi:hypothetical protein